MQSNKSKQKNKKLLSVLLPVLVLLLVGLTVWMWWGNTVLEVNRYTVASQKIPTEFDGFRIAQVSDLHSAEMGENNEKLLGALREAQPDVIALTGDLITYYNPKQQIALEFIKNAVQIAPCYYVTGNHEARMSDYAAFEERLTALGVVALDNQRVEIEANGAVISLLGLKDPKFYDNETAFTEEEIVNEQLSTLVENSTENQYTILLSHRPEMFEIYAENKMDLVLSGHVHGGQLRLPFFGGVYAPNQGVFPKYDAGLYSEGNTAMIVSRGIGQSIFPFRINNPPELVLIELQSL
ncbi:MAG: metallophosphoesterase [Clostridia bacterium]|nr:metallophosphoesterase [Clostridia bacterium]